MSNICRTCVEAMSVPPARRDEAKLAMPLSQRDLGIDALDAGRGTPTGDTRRRAHHTDTCHAAKAANNQSDGCRSREMCACHRTTHSDPRLAARQSTAADRARRRTSSRGAAPDQSAVRCRCTLSSDRHAWSVNCRRVALHERAGQRATAAPRATDAPRATAAPPATAPPQPARSKAMPLPAASLLQNAMRLDVSQQFA